ncbi:flagellar assembly peptidoglycan hydrolase FlgJ [Pseudomonas sp. WN033]|nr:flagellar assembly peptidoglycan hydrolase FlgJ [Pseudomonas sp. WN033]
MNLTSQQSLNYTDLNAMSQLKHGSQANSPGNLRRVAEQFESLFLNMMVKSMRDANEVFAEGNPLNTNQTRFYQDMYDNQMSVHLAEKQGVGLADMMVRQMSPKGQSAGSQAAEAAPAADQSALLARRRLAMISRNPAVMGEGAAPVNNERPVSQAESVTNWQPLRAMQGVSRTAPAQSSASETAIAGRRSFANPAEFVATMLPMAERAAERLGIDPHYLVAQAALETGWGRSFAGGNSHNLFGIKAHGGWQGDSASAMTHEFRDGALNRERANFRAYASFEQSFDDYVEFLHRNGRYQQALQTTDNPDAFFRELQRAGYATDPQYASKVSRIARQLLSQQATAGNDNRQLS